MVRTLTARTRSTPRRTLQVCDAGIATEANLELVRKMGHNYLCVSRVRLRDYTTRLGRVVTVRDARGRGITLREVCTEEGGDHYLEVTSPSKAMTEASMNRLLRSRFETEMAKVNAAIGRKGGTKRYERVVERVGRVIERYPSIARHHSIAYVRSVERPCEMVRVDWAVKEGGWEGGSGVYFLRTNVVDLDGRTAWDYYNLIREIECTNRQLKTDLNLRPIYHQKDGRGDAHLFLGLLSYWVVNTIRHQLKLKGENCYWTEIVRRMSTQMLVTTTVVNALGQKVEFRQCSRPSKQAAEIYDKLNFKHAPFKKVKICTPQKPPD